MSTRTPHRISAGLAPLVVAGLALSACGGSDGEAASLPTVTLEAGATSYATLPPATIASEAADEASTTVDPTAVQEYEVQAGDYGLKVASDFGVSIEDLENVNGWSDAGKEFPFPGTIIKIPAGGTAPAATPAETPAATPAEGDAETPATGSEPGSTGEAIPEVGDNCEPGSYVITEEDNTRFKVAEKFDVTVEAMDAANTGTNGYSAFYPGLTIIIPGKDDC